MASGIDASNMAPMWTFPSSQHANGVGVLVGNSITNHILERWKQRRISRHQKLEVNIVQVLPQTVLQIGSQGGTKCPCGSSISMRSTGFLGVSQGSSVQKFHCRRILGLKLLKRCRNFQHFVFGPNPFSRQLLYHWFRGSLLMVVPTTHSQHSRSAHKVNKAEDPSCRSFPFLLWSQSL